MKSRTLGVIWVALFLFFFGTLYYVQNYGNPFVKKQETREIVIKMNKKYNEEFLIDNPYYDSINQDYFVSLHPTSNSQIPILARLTPEGELEDDYAEAKWNREVHEYFIDVVEKHCPPNATIFINVPDGRDLRRIKSGPLPSFQQANVLVHIAVEVNHPLENEESEKKWIYQLIKELQPMYHHLELLVAYRAESSGDGGNMFLYEDGELNRVGN